MYQLIEQLSTDTGVSIEDTNNMLLLFCGAIVKKIPQLQQVIDDVFINADEELLHDHINRLSVLIQQQESEKHKLRSFPGQEYYRIKRSRGGELF